MRLLLSAEWSIPRSLMTVWIGGSSGSRSLANALCVVLSVIQVRVGLDAVASAGWCPEIGVRWDHRSSAAGHFAVLWPNHGWGWCWMMLRRACNCSQYAGLPFFHIAPALAGTKGCAARLYALP